MNKYQIIYRTRSGNFSGLVTVRANSDRGAIVSAIRHQFKDDEIYAIFRVSSQGLVPVNI